MDKIHQMVNGKAYIHHQKDGNASIFVAPPSAPGTVARSEFTSRPNDAGVFLQWTLKLAGGGERTGIAKEYDEAIQQAADEALHDAEQPVG